jgi:hypothetical protein
MAQTSPQHSYQIGDAVLAILDGVRIPGVIQDQQEGKLLVQLSQPWVDATGQSSDSVWLTPDRLEAYIEEETGGSDALPG